MEIAVVIVLSLVAIAVLVVAVLMYDDYLTYRDWRRRGKPVASNWWRDVFGQG